MSAFIPILGRVTSYGYPEDSTPDSNSEAGIGAWDNTLVDKLSLAISRDIEASFHHAGIHPRDTVELLLSSQAILTLRWDDRTAKEYKGKILVGRFDIYGQHRPSAFVDTHVIGFRRG